MRRPDSTASGSASRTSGGSGATWPSSTPAGARADEELPWKMDPAFHHPAPLGRADRAEPDGLEVDVRPVLLDPHVDAAEAPPREQRDTPRMARPRELRNRLGHRRAGVADPPVRGRDLPRRP